MPGSSAAMGYLPRFVMTKRSAGSRFCAASSFFSRSARANEARCLAVCLGASAMVRPRGAGYLGMSSIPVSLLIILALPLLLLPRPSLLIVLHLSLTVSLAVLLLGPVVHFIELAVFTVARLRV